ncbi:MAG: peptide chain release factor N(5)-glutamine methyltransferase [Gammaproteobacteria bacterium]|nr:peptide chain release factor N(5)-glutamine methyltransferase [Gammaproteobacteria bacterium]
MSISIREALAEGAGLQSVSDSWKLDTELLLAHCLGSSREFLFSWPEQSLSTGQLETFRDYLGRRAQGEPVAYLLGTRQFWDIELRVDSRVLIPRPETELLVEHALELGSQSGVDALRVADLGTGSGAIAIALAKTNPAWRVTAVELSEEALAVAASNAALLDVHNIEFRLGSWCDELAEAEFDMILANPPYVAEGDQHLTQGDLLFEPSMALIADRQGLGALEHIIDQCRRCLKKDAWLLLEHGFDQQAGLKAHLLERGYANICGYKDYAGIDRMICASWAGG